MFGLFNLVSQILCWVKQIGAMVLNACIDGFNAVIAAIASAIGAILSTLPAMPSPPTLPSWFTTAEGWAAFFWPVGTTVDAFAFIFAAWLVWLGVSLLLRWARAIS